MSLLRRHIGSQNVPYKTALATFCLYFDEVHSRTPNQSRPIVKTFFSPQFKPAPDLGLTDQAMLLFSIRC